jgi:molybdopterin converting factor subunit 1
MVKVKLFAGFREQVKKSQIEIKIEGEATLSKFVDLLIEEYPELGKLFDNGNAIIAVNREVADENTKVKDEDEVAIFPPVSGG